VNDRRADFAKAMRGGWLKRHRLALTTARSHKSPTWEEDPSHQGDEPDQQEQAAVVEVVEPSY
jgi:hypothetical protein